MCPVKPLRLSHQEYADFYSELCDVVCRFDLEISDEDPYTHTSPHARALARDIVDRMADLGYLEYR